jgi:hypothetical protein
MRTDREPRERGYYHVDFPHFFTILVEIKTKSRETITPSLFQTYNRLTNNALHSLE